MSNFIQLHTLTSHPASLLNRGEEGFAKTIPFGGVTRTRISSQCLKYHWRTYEGEDSIRDISDVEMSVRSRKAFYHLVAKPLIEEGYEPAVVYPITYLVMQSITDANESNSISDLIGAAREDDSGALETDQVVVFGPQELGFIKSVIRDQVEAVDPEAEDLEDQIDEAQENLTTKEIMESVDAIAPAGVDAAMFGRMVTDGEGSIDAGVHVKHAMTVHQHQQESDYFLTADDFQSKGGAHLNNKQLTSGLYYTNVVVDLDQLTHSLSGRDDIARELAGRLLVVMTTVTPGAKKSSTAPYSRSEFVLVETGPDQPRTLANAFRTPAGRDASVEEVCDQLAGYVERIDAMYGWDGERMHAGPAHDIFGENLSIQEIRQRL